jgi:SAM-dependent methyltransferase
MSEPGRFQHYYRATEQSPPRRTLLTALDGFRREGRGTSQLVAVDLGCGTGRDALPLLEAGWRVIAIDAEPAALDKLGSRAGPSARLELIAADFTNAPLPACDLVNASFALPLCPPETFSALWARITAALRPGGRFAGQLYGPRDGWAGRPGMTTHDRADVDRLLLGWQVELLDEEESDGSTARGTAKHWHVWHIVARQP